MILVFEWANAGPLDVYIKENRLTDLDRNLAIEKIEVMTKMKVVSIRSICRSIQPRIFAR